MMAALPAVTRSDVGCEQLIGGHVSSEANQERPVAIGDTVLRPFVDGVDRDIPGRGFGNLHWPAGGSDDLANPPVFTGDFGDRDSGICLGHFRNLIPENSRSKPSEFHTENNSSFYAGNMSQSVNMQDVPDTWNGRLRWQRKKLGLSVPALAWRIVGEDADHHQWVSTRERISSYEKTSKGRKPVEQPRGGMMVDLARALEVPIEWLRDGAEAPVNDPSTLDRSVIASSETPSVSSVPNAARVEEPFPKSSRRYIDEVGRAAGGKEGKFILNGEPIGRVLAPPSVEAATNPYIVRVIGSSMVPRYEEDERLIVNPDMPYGKGNYVVVQLRTDDPIEFECYVKKFISFGARDLVLEQLNPPKGHDAIMRFPRSRVHMIHKVVGVLDA